MKKVFFILLALCVLLTSTAFASFTVLKSGGLGSIAITRNHPHTDDIRYSPEFTENNTTFQFSGMYYKGDQSDNIYFNKGWKDKWNIAVKGFDPFLGYNTMQIRDDNTGKIFYTLSDNESPAYILGYDFGKNKVIQYIKSANYYSPNTGMKEIVVKNGELYLAFYPYLGGGRLAYRLFWDPKANWFGYEDVGSDF